MIKEQVKINSKESRTRNVSRNAVFGLITQIIRIFLEFIIRTVFIKKLGEDYLGVNGLFTNVLTILSFAELGIGNAIIFNMYKEVANENIEKLKSLMAFYKKAYITIGIAVLTIGGLITPFIPKIINGKPNISDNIFLIYVLFLINTGISYFFAYKKSIISAYQKEYIISTIKLISEILKSILQILVLIIFNDYILFLIIQIVSTLLDNLIASIEANRRFKFLKDKNVKPLPQTEKSKIFTNVRALVMYKFGSVILNGTDNIIISSMLNIATVGIVSNFNLIINTLTTLIASVLNGFTSSIGNLNSNNDVSKQEDILNELQIICVWIYGFCSIMFIILANDFMKLWIGSNYQLAYISVIAIGLHFYINGVQFAGYTYRTTMGLFEKGKYCPVIGSVINIILSIVLCKIIGLTGIILATSISRLLTTTWYDIYMIYKYKFKKSPIKYYSKYLFYFVITTLIFIICNYVSSFISSGLIETLIIKFIISALLINIIYFLVFCKNRFFQDIIQRIKLIINRKQTFKL